MEPKTISRWALWRQTLILALALSSVAHAQPSAWQSYDVGSTRHYEGTDRNGGHWSGSSYRAGGGSTVNLDVYGPHGQQQHCRSYESAGTMHTDCW